MKKIALMMLAFTASVFLTSIAPNDHPGYLVALSDLRASHWMLQHTPANSTVTRDEAQAIAKINDAINEIKKAAIDDGKDINDHPKADEINDHMGRLKKAMEYLDKAHADIDKEGDNNFANGLKARANKDIEEAREAVKRAMSGVK